MHVFLYLLEILVTFRFVKDGLNIGLNTDDPTIFCNTLDDDYKIAKDHFNFTSEQLKQCVSSFLNIFFFFFFFAQCHGQICVCVVKWKTLPDRLGMHDCQRQEIVSLSQVRGYALMKIECA